MYEMFMKSVKIQSDFSDKQLAFEIAFPELDMLIILN